MEIIQRVSFSVISSVFKIFSFGVVFVLDIAEGLCFKSQALLGLGSDEGRELKLGLAFPNGQQQEAEFIVDGNQSTEPKRVKLLLDIHVHPDEKYEVVSATNVNHRSRINWLPFDRLVETVAYYLLRVIKIVREIIHETDRFLAVTSSKSSKCNGSQVDTENRKKISPRKRVSKSHARSFRRYVANVKKILGFGKEERVIFDPIEGIADVSLNGSLNNSKLKATEKRKHRASSTSDTEYTDDDEEAQFHDTDDQKLTEEKHDQSIEVSSTEATTTADDSTVQEADGDLDESGGTPKSKNKGSTSGNSANYFEVAEGYQSAEDPDYIPSPHGSESSSEGSDVEEPQEKLMEEVEGLKLDLQNGGNETSTQKCD